MVRTRVVQITHDLGVGGLPGVVSSLCTNLDRRRFEVAVLCLNERGDTADELESAGVPVYEIGRRETAADYFAFAKVATFLRRHGADVVHTHNTQPFIDGGLGGILARVPMHIHTDHARRYPDKWRYLAAEWLLAHSAHRVVGVSDHTSRQLVCKGRLPAEKVVTVPNGIEDPLAEASVDPRAKRAELDIDPAAPVIGVGVRLAEQKGLSYLIEAMSSVLRAVPNARLVIAGYGPLRDALGEQARRRGVSDHVLFLGKRMDMIEVMQAFDVYALPSIWEGLPLVVLEAMAVGCPVVASDVGGVSSAVEHGENGLLVEPRQPDQLAEALVRVLCDRDRRLRLGKNGRERFVKHFTAETMARRYGRLYLRDRPMAKDPASREKTSSDTAPSPGEGA